ncbi:hypothetical protein PINS_up018238, partial [Pythium insidiosum]
AFLSTSAGGGVIQTSASESLLCAIIGGAQPSASGPRGRRAPSQGNRLVMYISDQTHSIGEKGRNGAGPAAPAHHPDAVVARTDPGNYGMHPDDVAAAMQEDVAAVSSRSSWCRPSARRPRPRSTRSASLGRRRARAQQEPVWVHVDGAYGGAATLCPEFQHWFDGVEDVDSLCVNAHKWMMIAVDCSMMRSRSIPNTSRSDFMSQINYKDWQVPLGRRFRALSFGSRCVALVPRGLRAHIRRSIELAKRAESQLH